MDKLRIITSSNTDINAVYFGIALSGYEYADIDKSDDIIEMLQQIRSYSGLDEAKQYFSNTRQPLCEVYPFWPRAALLESATFFINGKSFDFDSYCTYVKALPNLTTEEKSEDFFCWAKDSPKYVTQIKSDPFFQNINTRIHSKVTETSLNSIEKTRLIEGKLEKLSATVESAISTISLIICPFKCVYSADYFTEGSVMSVILGNFLPSSIVHEYLHPIVRLHIKKYRERIVTLDGIKHLDLDKSYYMNNDEKRLLNAFEENIVRKISDSILYEIEINIEKLIFSELSNKV